MLRSKEIQKQLRNKTVDMNQATADQKEHKGSSHICQKISWLSPRLFGKYSVDWWDKSLTFWKVCVSRYLWHKTNTAFHKKNIIPTVKQCDGLGLLCSFRTWMTCHNWWNHEFCTKGVLKENVRPSVCDLKLKHTWVMQQDNDHKLTSKFTSEWLKKN